MANGKVFAPLEWVKKKIREVDSNKVEINLLWINENTTSPTNVSLDLTNYSMVLVLFHGSNTISPLFESITEVGKKGELQRVSYYNNSVLHIYRAYEVSQNGIIFADAYKNGSVDNAGNIPYKIYGIK